MPYGYGSANKRGPSGPGPGGQGARGQATQNPGRAPKATPVTTGGPPSVLNPPPKTKTVTTGGPPSVLNPPPKKKIITGGGGPPSVLNPPTPTGITKTPTGITNTDKFRKVVNRLKNVQWDRYNPLNLLFGSAAHAKPYSTEDMIKLLGITDQATAEKYVKDPVWSGPTFITREDLDQKNRTQAEAMAKFTENLLKEETKYPEKNFETQRLGALEYGISPTDRSLIPSDFLNQPGEAATQMPFSDIAAEIEKKYPMARGGIVNLFKYGGFLG